MEVTEIKISQLRRNIGSSVFQTRYRNLILGNKEGLSDEAVQHLLKLAVIFLNYGDTNIQRLGYRIVIRYSVLFSDYKPLFDVSINKGFIPISKFIEEKQLISSTTNDQFFSTYFSSYQDNFKQNSIYLTYGQKKLIHFSDSNKDNFVLVAPTSYGKSEIIISKISDNLDKKICVIVPSKALLAQTKRRILSSEYASQIGRIITHPEMYRGDEQNFVAVLTQERLLRLLQKNPLVNLDLVLIDEAHNLLKRNNRAVLLAQVLMIILKRNTNAILNFFSPFVSDGKNLKIPHVKYNLVGEHSLETIKVERYYNCDVITNKKLFMYDQFLNEFNLFNAEIYHSDLDLIKARKATKNIVYLNKPRDVEAFALRLAENNQNKQVADVVNNVIGTIAEFLHPDYNLLKCLKNGVAYHHGGMPELVRLYVENAFSTNIDLEFIVTSSTLLEGVNIPAEKIFLLTTKIGRSNFSKSEFKNLIGRVCRFSEIFDVKLGKLNMLEPEIYLIKSEYENSNANHQTFLQSKAKIDLNLSDDVENILLKEEATINDPVEKQLLRDSLEYLENIEPNTVVLENVQYVESDIAKLCYRNNVYDFDIKINEANLVANISAYLLQNITIDNPIQLMEAIFNVFIFNIQALDESLGRLSNVAARNFYAMVLDWRTKSSSFKEMIARFMGYWSTLNNPVIFFGSAWGEVKRTETDHIPSYINLNTKTSAERINLAIIKIKDEQDFIEFRLLKYIEILYELELVEFSFYEKIKYGSSDKRIISLLKNGFSIELAKILTDIKYQPFITINTSSDEILINAFIVDIMKDNQESDILIFEIRYHIKHTG